MVHPQNNNMKIHPDSFYPSRSKGKFVKWNELSKDDIKHLIENGHWDGVEVQPVKQESKIYKLTKEELIQLVCDFHNQDLNARKFINSFVAKQNNS